MPQRYYSLLFVVLRNICTCHICSECKLHYESTNEHNLLSHFVFRIHSTVSCCAYMGKTSWRCSMEIFVLQLTSLTIKVPSLEILLNVSAWEVSRPWVVTIPRLYGSLLPGIPVGLRTEWKSVSDRHFLSWTRWKILQYGIIYRQGIMGRKTRKYIYLNVRGNYLCGQKHCIRLRLMDYPQYYQLDPWKTGSAWNTQPTRELSQTQGGFLPPALKTRSEA